MGERRRQEEKERKKERKEKKVAELARIQAEEKAKARAKKAMADREREAKWAKFAPKGPVKKDPKMLSWDGGFTKAKALEMSLSEDGQDETEATNEGTATLDEREVLDESDDSMLVTKVGLLLHFNIRNRFFRGTFSKIQFFVFIVVCLFV